MQLSPVHPGHEEEEDRLDRLSMEMKKNMIFIIAI